MIFRVYTLLLAVLTIGPLAYQLQASTLWGNLESGPYRVGYRTIFTYDLSRPSITVDAEGRAVDPPQRGRQMQISVWYPAVKTARQSFMRFEEYVYLLSQELNFSPLTTKQAKQSVDTFMKGRSRGARPLTSSMRL